MKNEYPITNPYPGKEDYGPLIKRYRGKFRNNAHAKMLQAIKAKKRRRKRNKAAHKSRQINRKTNF